MLSAQRWRLAAKELGYRKRATWLKKILLVRIGDSKRSELRMLQMKSLTITSLRMDV